MCLQEGLGLNSLSLLLLGPHRQPGVAHGALTHSLDLHPVGLGAEEPIGRTGGTTGGQCVWLSAGALPFRPSKNILFLCSMCLIPAYTFGETELYNQHIFTPGGFINSFQNWSQRPVHIYPCAFYRRGFTENSWGLLPYARPVTTIGEWALVLAASSWI